MAKMLVAIDSSNRRVSIFNAVKGSNYYCQTCHQLVFQKKNCKKITPHFSHYPSTSKRVGYTKCTDDWVYDITEWHADWQMRFPEENIEIVVSDGHKKHRADVLINGTVVEFQHSELTYKQFVERNEFYTKCGYKVIWVFDFSSFIRDDREDHEEQIVPGTSDNEYIWDNPKALFRKMKVSEEKASIFFQLSDEENDDESILSKVKYNTPKFKHFYVFKNLNYSVNEFIEAVKKGDQKLFYKYIDNVPEPQFEQNVNGGKTICEIHKQELNEEKYSGMIVYNALSKKTMRINLYDGKLQTRYNGYDNQIIGKYCRKRVGMEYYDIYKDRDFIVWQADEPVWFLLKKFEYTPEQLEEKRKQKENQIRIEKERREKEEQERYKRIAEEKNREKKSQEAYRKAIMEQFALVDEANDDTQAESTPVLTIKKEPRKQSPQQNRPLSNKMITCMFCGKTDMDNLFASYQKKSDGNYYGKCYDCVNNKKNEPIIVIPNNNEPIDDKSKPETITKEKYCQICKNKMIVKQGKYGPFWSCSDYPNCKYTEDYK